MIDLSSLKTADIKKMLAQGVADEAAFVQAMKEDKRVSVQKLAQSYLKRKIKEEAERERVLHMYAMETAYYNDGIYRSPGGSDLFRQRDRLRESMQGGR